MHSKGFGDLTCAFRIAQNAKNQVVTQYTIVTKRYIFCAKHHNICTEIMMKRHTTALLLFALCLVALVGRAQNNTNSPYTRFGYGQLNDGNFGRSQGMGSVGYGIRHKASINVTNPASYSCIDSTSFLFEIGVSGLLSHFKSGDAQNRRFTANFEYMALQFPITRWMGMSIGMIPYSFVGYNYGFSDSTTMPGHPGDTAGIHTTQLFSGLGGINQAFAGLSFDLWNRIAIGANFYYLFGNIDHYRYLNTTYSANTIYNSIYKSNLHVNSFNMRFGLQYHQPIGKKHMLTVGAIYEFKSPLGATVETSAIAVDTVVEVMTQHTFELPSVYGGGISYIYDNRLTVGADFTLQDFAHAKFYGTTDSLHNRIRACLGAEYIHNPMGQRYIDRMLWRVGANYTQSYINVKGQHTNDFSLTCGFGFPLRTIKSIINFNFEYGHIGSQAAFMLKENYFRMGLNISINENWFFKQKIK